ncbi:acetylornithine transaminase|uniref:Acetylornithine aminotransferase n=1 Tax=Dendrosporobacter quercicolus TaxID=146817 RepID=A0A1G9VBS6_9FIRM|nr:acetylornithine transaminase [Dendrosporobacter quercicolus]NSL47861.1 acetylornithine transaminase [Dendrosporobacter quercicolus DSM 1736]SDM69507.1 acetylornithine/N-succinyldiaminopimelate aminotransferase [Dendrosporobacter quercicolus]
MEKEEIFKIDQEHYMPVFSRYPLVLTRGEGPYVYDIDGKKYIDFLAGIAVNVLGHAHPKLVRAIAGQAGSLIHCSNLYYTEVQAKLVKSLAALSGLDKVFLANSGAEANEGAIKLARKYGKTLGADKVDIITARDGFHGRTLLTLTATAQPKYQQGYEPLPGGFHYAPYNDLPALKALVSAKTCAVVLEPIQGEGGVNIPDAGYLAGVRQLCDQYGAVLIFDEIQTGMGRTGKMFAYEHSGIKPDIVTLAKGLAGGVPAGAFIASNKVAAAFAAGDHGSTFGGNPLACAAANAVLEIIAAEDLVGNAGRIGQYMLAGLEGLRQKYPRLISAVRGQGLMLGVKLTRPGRDIVNQCLEHGAIINCTAGDVLRFVPPLNVTGAHVDEVIAILDKVLARD